MSLKLCILQVTVVMAHVGLPCPRDCVVYKGHIICFICISLYKVFQNLIFIHSEFCLNPYQVVRIYFYCSLQHRGYNRTIMYLLPSFLVNFPSLHNIIKNGRSTISLWGLPGKCEGSVRHTRYIKWPTWW